MLELWMRNFEEIKRTNSTAGVFTIREQANLPTPI
jgi:hypothetical protein